MVFRKMSRAGSSPHILMVPDGMRIMSYACLPGFISDSSMGSCPGKNGN